jgi:hypothetical protein
MGKAGALSDFLCLLEKFLEISRREISISIPNHLPLHDAYHQPKPSRK